MKTPKTPYCVVKYFERGRFEVEEYHCRYELVTDPFKKGRDLTREQAMMLVTDNRLTAHTIDGLGTIWDDGQFLEAFRGSFAKLDAEKERLEEEKKVKAKEVARQRYFRACLAREANMAEDCSICWAKVFEQVRSLGLGISTYMKLMSKDEIDSAWEQIDEILEGERKFTTEQCDGYVRITRIQ